MSFQLEDPPGSKEIEFDNLEADAKQRLRKGETTPALSRQIKNEDELAEDAIGHLKNLGVDFGDIRLGRDLSRSLHCQDENISHHGQSITEGIGIRAFVRGFWGFSATDDLTSAGIRTCAAEAAAMAKAVAATTPNHLGVQLNQFAMEPVHHSEYYTATGICPFATPTPQLAEPFLASAKIALEKPAIKRVVGGLSAYGYRRIFASTEGSRIKTTHVVTDGQVRVYAVDNATSAYRTFIVPGLAGGLEHLYRADLPKIIPSLCEDALAKCHAAKMVSGHYDLILDGHNLALTMHESVGHPTELDRVMGYEFGFAGGSFAGLDKLGHFQYGSSIVNFTANNKLRYGGATVGYDDEGVMGQSFPIIREGVLVGYGTNRETAHMIGQKRANGTCRATHWWDTPIVRIPNLFLEPGVDKLSLSELIADTNNGILMLGRDSFSIDQMRYNFQFGADMCYRIKDGRLAEPLRDVIYQAISPEFWNSCDAICDETEWQMHGVFNCGKGQPSQTARMMHGASPSRFKNIKVGF